MLYYSTSIKVIFDNLAFGGFGFKKWYGRSLPNFNFYFSKNCQKSTKGKRVLFFIQRFKSEVEVRQKSEVSFDARAPRHRLSTVQ